MSAAPLPQNYFQHLIGEFKQAGWTVSGVRPILKAVCPCVEQHITYLRAGNLTLEYTKFKIHWLFNESCYIRD